LSANYLWLGLFLVLWAVVFLIVPRERIVTLLMPSFLGGTVIALITNLIGVSILGMWRFPVALLPLFGIPLFMLLAYMPEMLIFLHYWEHLPGGTAEKGIYLATFGFLNTAVAYFAVIMGYLIFIRWNFIYFFLLSVVLHALAVVIFTTPQLRNAFRKV